MKRALERLAAYWYSLRYQQATQISGRLQYWLAWKIYPRFPSAVATYCELAARACQTNPDSFSSRPAIAGSSDGGSNRFSLLNETVDFNNPVDWNPPGRSLLWLFHLHYFDWAQACDAETLSRQIESWIDSNPPGSWPGWHPYPTSLRIVNWLRALQGALHLQNEKEPGSSTSASRFKARIEQSLAQQAAFLEINLEHHLGGNHLLENARALLMAGLHFEGAPARRWRAAGLALLRAEISQQVLPDGGHCERSPYYHARVTDLLEDVIRTLADRGCPAPSDLTEAAARMASFRGALRHRDGSLPLFHDSLGPAPPRNSAPSCARISFPFTGYYILESSQGRMIADYGAPGSSPNPAHQHAGIFSYEISSARGRVVVDSGTATYEAGPGRDRLRATPAHNTVCVDGLDQFQVWRAFRAGRRAWVGSVVEIRRPDCEILSASHNGYRRLGVEHRRSIVHLAGAGWLVVDDLLGRKRRHLESFVHFAPEMAPEIHGSRVCLPPLGWALVVFGFEAPPAVRADFFSPAVGVVQPSKTLVLKAEASLPLRFGYWLGYDASVTWDGSCRVQIEAADRSVVVQLGPIGSNAAFEVRYN
ncbi:MAG TPA: alginate lyase family protein [Bryobacterales bacterium]|jgi:uncharacterized heparinase superfamily protein|nr:alginate lyase family protein [Bryobacterales bacterium]